jgi:hypothetical protein
METQAQALPPASLEALKRLRAENCGGDTKEFHLQSFQIFLRRALSPESPTRSMLLFHGTGSGKTCSAIQVAEEYIVRPEFQDKKVLVLAGKAVQKSFQTQIFDVTRVTDENGLLTSEQCTGHRYLDMLQRAYKERLDVSTAEKREALQKTIDGIVDEFYQFDGYQSFAGGVERLRLSGGVEAVRQEYANRLLIIDEAHNLRSEDETFKLASAQIEYLVKNVPGMTLVLLSATPMYDTFDEMMYYINLFLWNDRKQKPDERVLVKDIFKEDGDFKTPEAEATFRGWIHDYVSFIRGENPFTFPFRLPPPTSMIAPADRTTDPRGKNITKPRKYLPLVASILEEPQGRIVELAIGTSRTDMIPTLIVSPIEGRKLRDCFQEGSNTVRFRYAYKEDTPKFLAPSQLRKHATKFATALDCIKSGEGVCFVYSNYVMNGTEMFAAALEEAGFLPAFGPRMLENPANEVRAGSAGQYALMTETTIERLLLQLRSAENVNGDRIKVIVGSPFISEGVDFRFIRQIHVLDPWDNMSRMEQIIGRGLRTCSHALLPFEKQNCTVYLHIVRYADSTQETYDEFVYRDRVETKAVKIAKVKRVLEESAVDCKLQLPVNSLTQDWRDLLVPQNRSQDKQTLTLPLSKLSSPSFEDGTPALVCSAFETPATEGVRPLSAYYDIQDEVYRTLVKLFQQKPIWSRKDLLESKKLRIDQEALIFLLDSARTSSLKLKDKQGNVGLLESTDDMYAFKPIDHATMVERTIPLANLEFQSQEIPVEEEKKEEAKPAVSLEALRAQQVWKFGVESMPPAVLDWYIVDSVMTSEEKRAHMLSLDRASELPLYARGLVVPGVQFLVLGKDQIYNDEGELVTPVGTDKDAYDEWLRNHIASVVSKIKEEDRILCTMSANKAGQLVLKFAAFEVAEGHVRRASRTKTVDPKDCTFYSVGELAALVSDLGAPFPESIQKKADQCYFLNFVVRDAILRAHPKIVWIQPELWDVLSNEPARTTLRGKLK